MGGLLLGALIVLGIMGILSYAKNFSPFKACPTCPTTGSGGSGSNDCQWFSFPNTYINDLQMHDKTDTTGKTLTDVEKWVMNTLGTSLTNCKDVVILWSEYQGNFYYGQTSPTKGVANNDWTAYVLSKNKPIITM
jgi:hypothetical protein